MLWSIRLGGFASALRLGDETTLGRGAIPFDAGDVKEVVSLDIFERLFGVDVSQIQISYMECGGFRGGERCLMSECQRPASIALPSPGPWSSISSWRKSFVMLLLNTSLNHKTSKRQRREMLTFSSFGNPHALLSRESK